LESSDPASKLASVGERFGKKRLAAASSTPNQFIIASHILLTVFDLS
jgi:hypothetical protein